MTKNYDLPLIPSGPPWYHGGRAGLRVGDYLIPRAVSGVEGWSGISNDWDREHEYVYITQYQELAVLYAGGFTKPGAVYRVKPVGKVSLDSYCFGLCSHQQFRCRRARIVAVEFARVSLGNVVSAELAIWKKYQAPALRRDIDRLRKWWAGDSQSKAPMVKA